MATETTAARARRLLRDALGAADGGDLETAREVTEAALAALSDDPPAPSLPVDGGDGRRWPTPDNDGHVELGCGMCNETGVDAQRGDACDWCDGSRTVLGIAPPVSSSAGDETREALERVLSNAAAMEAAAQAIDAYVPFTAGNLLHMASAFADAARAAVAALPSPLQGAGDGGDDLRERMVSVLRDVARTRRSDAWGNVAVAAQELLAEIDPAPAVEQKETTR